MLSYQPLWDTMKQRNITGYKLLTYYGFSSNTLRRMKHGLPVSSKTLNSLCLVLNCRIEEVVRFEPTKEEIDKLIEQKMKEMKVNERRKKSE